MRLIVVDGLDGAGKDTVAAMIAHELKKSGSTVLVRSHPSPRFAGSVVLRMLRKHGIFARILSSLFFAVDVLASVMELREERKQLDFAILVRYIMSSAYLPSELHIPIYNFLHRVMPRGSLMLYVDVRPETAMARIRGRRNRIEVFENLESLREARRKALKLTKKDWVIVRNEGSLSELRQSLARYLRTTHEK